MVGPGRGLPDRKDRDGRFQSSTCSVLSASSTLNVTLPQSHVCTHLKRPNEPPASTKCVISQEICRFRRLTPLSNFAALRAGPRRLRGHGASFRYPHPRGDC